MTSFELILRLDPGLERGRRKVKFLKCFSCEIKESRCCLCLRLSLCSVVLLTLVIQYSHVSWWECESCKGFLLCMPSIIYLFVVFYVD